MPLSRDDITRLIDIEEKLQNVPTGLARAVAYHESGFDPQIEGDGGNSIGVFQLQKKAAIDAGIDPKDRWDPAKNVFAGVRYVRQKLDQSGGKIDEALSRYNRGTPDYRGIGDPNYVERVKRYYQPEGTPAATPAPAQQPQQPGILARMGSALSPASAEAATPQAAPRTRLEEIEAELTRREQQAAPQAPGATTAPPPVSQTAPTTQPPPGASQGPQTPDTSWTPGMRFQALPSIQQLEPADRMQKTKLFESLDPQMQQEFLRSEEPQAASLAVGGGPSQQAPTVTDPAALLAVGGPAQAPPAPQTQAPAAPAPMTMRGQIGAIPPLQPRGAEAVQDRPHEAGIPLSAVPAMGVQTLGTMGGAALGALTSPLTGIVGPAAGAALGGSLAARANTALGLTGQEKPLLETPYANVYPSDLLGAIPLGIAGATAALKGTVRNLPGANVGRHELAGEKLEQLGQRVGPARPSSELFTEAAAQGGAVPTPTLWKAAGKVVREEKGMEKGFVSTEAMQAGSGLLDLMRKHGGNVPLDEVEKYRQRLFQKIQTTTDKAELKRLQDLYGAIHEDLTLAATSGTAAGAGTLKAAIAAKRKEHAQETLMDVWSPGKGLQLQEGNHTQIYGKRIRNEVEKKLHSDKLFAGSFTAAETVDIRNTLREVGKLTRMTNPDAQGAVGSTLKWLGRLGGAGGAGYGVATGDMTTMLTGGAMLLATEGATAVLTSAMQSNMGRWALREAIREGNGTLTHGSLSAIAALLAREAAPEAPAPAPAPTP